MTNQLPLRRGKLANVRTTNEQIIQEVCGDKKVYILLENGWYYSDFPVKWFNSPAEIYEAIGCTEEEFKNQGTAYNSEGFWYYSIKEIALSDLIKEYTEKLVRDALYRQADADKNKIVAAGNKELTAAAKRAECDRIRGLITNLLKEI